MTDNKTFDVIIVGGSYSGLAAGMALGRASKKVLIIDEGKPCNRQTPYSHNFITQDGKTPAEISTLAKKQVEAYKTVEFSDGLATGGYKTTHGFDIHIATGKTFSAKKLIFATGIRDILPEAEGFAECWGISVVHCPYCHGYEIKNEKTGIVGNGVPGFDFARLISNWTSDLTLFTNGCPAFTVEQAEKLKNRQIKWVESEIHKLEYINGYIKQIIFKDGSSFPLKALYAPVPFAQHCTIPETLGCAYTDEGYILTDPFQETSVSGIYACGDNSTRMRTVANAVAMGTTAGISLSKKMILEEF
jgi:thioredoxin reductase